MSPLIATHLGLRTEAWCRWNSKEMRAFRVAELHSTSGGAQTVGLLGATPRPPAEGPLTPPRARPKVSSFPAPQSKTDWPLVSDG
jgi:hypothetical protein